MPACDDGELCSRRGGGLHLHPSIGEVELLLRLLLLSECEGSLVISLWCEIDVVFIIVLAEVFLYDRVGLLVNVLICVVLAAVDFLHTARFFYVERESIHAAVLCLLEITDLQDVLETIKGDLNDFVIKTIKQITEWFDGALLHKVLDLIWVGKSTRCCIRYCPTCFLLGLEVSSAK